MTTHTFRCPRCVDDNGRPIRLPCRARLPTPTGGLLRLRRCRICDHTIITQEEWDGNPPDPADTPCEDTP
jgi:hypothetical protein